MTKQVDDQAAEAEVIGSSHTQLGRLLMEKWRMPEAVKVCVRHHHTFDHAADHTNLAAIVAYANLLSHAFGHQPQPNLI